MAKASSIIRVSVVGDATDLAKAFKGAEKSTKSLGEKAKGASRTITNNITLPLIGAGAAVIALAQKQEDAEARMTSAFDSMGAKAWTTTDALLANASALQDMTTFGDEAIIDLQGVLLTFGNVTDKIGAGNDIFSRATGLALDMSAALGTDLQGAAIQLGKALNDPVLGISALSEVGVSFTDDQKEVVASLMEMGDTAGAQKVILGELEKQFGGTAEAMAETASGQMAQAMNTLGDVGEEVGASLATIASEVIPNFVAGIEIVKSMFDLLPGPVKAAIAIIGGLVLALAALYAHPIIAGLALVAGAVAFIGSTAKDETPQVEGFKDALVDAGAVSKDTAKLALEARDDFNDLAVAFAEAGVTSDELSEALYRGGDAAHDVMGAMKLARDEGRLSEEQYDDLMETFIGLQRETNNARSDLLTLKKAEEDSKVPVDELTGSIDEQTAAHEEAQEALINYADEQRKAVDPLYALKDAQENVRKKQDELNSMVATGRTKTNEYKEKQYELITAYGDLEYAEEVYKSQADITVGAFEDMARNAGFTEDEIRDLIRAFQDLGSVSTGAQTDLGDHFSGGGGGGGTLHPMQTGGIVPGPTGSPVPVLAHSGEMVLNPQQQRALMRGGAGNGVTINVHAGTILTETGLEDVIIRVMSRYGLRNGQR